MATSGKEVGRVESRDGRVSLGNVTVVSDTKAARG